MVPRSVLAHRLKVSSSRLPFSLRHAPLYARSLTTQQTPTPTPQRDDPPHLRQLDPPPQTWLTKTITSNPSAKQVFFVLLKLLGYGSAKQYAGRRAFAMYSRLCVPRPDEEANFWKEELHLPPTFQSWFTITNLHVWLLTVRLRALPSPHGQNYVQGLIDHFFLDVEDRVRAVLQPAAPSTSLAPSQNLAPYTRPTDFYRPANPTAPDRVQPRGTAPERIVTRQMRIFREQWAGMGMSFDLGLVKSDAELAGAVWRNMLGARGARGIAYPSEEGQSLPYFRRTINLAGGEVEKVEKIAEKGLEAEEARDDGSGLYDHPPAEVDKYLRYPELMATMVEYVRRELVRLESLSDEDILGQGEFGTESEGMEKLKFGRYSRIELMTDSGRSPSQNNSDWPLVRRLMETVRQRAEMATEQDVITAQVAVVSDLSAC